MYEANFVREVKSILTDGVPSGQLQLQPVRRPEQPEQLFWGPDGAYALFVKLAAIVFIAVTSVRGAPRLPAWLVADLASLQATCTFNRNHSERALSGLKATVLASKQSRSADPLMIDHMLDNLGVDSEASAAQFVNRYNKMVGYDASLMLQDKAARRQANLLDESKCPRRMKVQLRTACDKADSFDEIGVTVDMMSLPEFWVGCVCVSTSHLQWRANCTTSPESCLVTLQAALDAASAGRRFTTAMYRALSRRVAFFIGVRSGVLARKSVSSAVADRYQAMVLDGTYDEDIDGLVESCDEDVGTTAGDMDKYLAEVSSLVQDILESHESESAQQDTDANTRAEAAVSMDDAEWWMAECAHDAQIFRKVRAERARKAASLKAKEDEHKVKVDRNVLEATTGFVDKHLPIASAVYGADGFWRQLQQDVAKRTRQVAQEAQCDVKQVLRVVFADMSVA